jgi:hypothetical protein
MAYARSPSSMLLIPMDVGEDHTLSPEKIRDSI